MAKDESSSRLSDEEVDEEVRKIEAVMDAEPGFIDLDRIGKTMIILGLVFYVSYIALFLLSTMVQVEETWGMFNIWSTAQFLVVNVICIEIICFECL